MKARKQRLGSRTQTAARAVSFVLTCYALSGPAATTVTSSVDGGGGASGAGATVNDGCIGGCVGVSAAGATAARHGYAGQLAEPASLALKGSPGTLGEGAASQLSGAAVLDDDTLTALAGSDIVWGVCAYPLASLDPAGLATASLVYSNTAAEVRGTYLGVPGMATLQVLDTLADNYGSYAGDGLPDWWQSAYFGVDNSEAAAAADPDHDGQDNRHEWTALTVPTNVLSQFRLDIESVSGEAGRKLLIFSPRREERVYTPQYRDDLADGLPWAPLTTVTTEDAGEERRVTDTNATSSAKFYRIQIAVP